MQRFLKFRLGCHDLPIATGRLAGAGHVDRLTGFVWLATVVLFIDEMHGFRMYRPGSFEATACRPFHASH